MAGRFEGLSELEWKLFADLLPQPPADMKACNATRTVWEDIEYPIRACLRTK